MDDLEQFKAAHELVCALCQPRGSSGSREWIMSIPARPDYDPDLVIGAALRRAMEIADELATLRSEVERLRGEIARHRKALKRCRAACEDIGPRNSAMALADHVESIANEALSPEFSGALSETEGT